MDAEHIKNNIQLLFGDSLHFIIKKETGCIFMKK